MTAFALRLIVVLLGLAPLAGAAQEPGAQRANGVLLVARESLLDPNFARTVVLATQTPDGGTLGVVLNRPLPIAPAEVLPPALAAQNYRDRVFAGGPVMRQAIVAVFESAAPPAAPAFRVLDTLWMSMHPKNIERLLGQDGGRYRLYAGFSGWAPRQLEGELLYEGWYVLPAEAALVFRADTGSLWRELVDRARATRTRAIGNPEMESPAGAGL